MSWVENDPDDLELIQIVIGGDSHDYDDDQKIKLEVAETIPDVEDTNDSIESKHIRKRVGRLNYKRYREQVDQLYNEFENNAHRPFFANKARLYQFPKSTVRDWYYRFLTNPSWRPYDSHHTSINRIFTDESETAITRFLIESLINQNIGITLRYLRKILLVLFNEFLLNELEELEEVDDFDYESIRAIHGSRKFLFAFMKRNHLSFRRLRSLRRPKIDNTEVVTFQQAIQFVRGLSVLHILVNADESNWLVVQAPKKIVAIKGSDSVRCLILGDPKAGFTFVGTICQTGLKLPIYAIARGKTDVCHKQFGMKHRDNCEIDHSLSGWMTNEIYQRYLIWIRKQLPISKFGSIHLVADQYGCHWYDGVEDFAATLDIFLIRVPKGGTSLYQPLDRTVYGELKANGQQAWEENFMIGDIPNPNKETALDLLLHCWDGIPESHIRKAWRFSWLDDYE
jgi:hypothetical protein